MVGEDSANGVIVSVIFYGVDSGAAGVPLIKGAVVFDLVSLRIIDNANAAFDLNGDIVKYDVVGDLKALVGSSGEGCIGKCRSVGNLEKSVAVKVEGLFLKSVPALICTLNEASENGVFTIL